MSIFDKLRRLVARTPSPAATPAPAGPSIQAVALPWDSGSQEEKAVAGYAIVDLREQLLLRVPTVGPGKHPETLMVATGAIAGYAAAHVMWETMIKPGLLQLKRDVHVAETTDGSKFYFGDPLNSFLIPEQGNTLSLYSLIAGRAVDAGLPIAELPNHREIFEHIAKVVGSSDFGVVRAPAGHQPHMTAPQALTAFWPMARQIMSNADNPGLSGLSLPIEHWPVAANLVAAWFVEQTKDVLDPKLSVRLIMEAAISMSKVDPRTVP